MKLPRFSNKKAFMAPLHLATIAALTPDDIEVDVWDESARGLIADSTEFNGDYDLVGVTGYTANTLRAIAIAQVFRKRGIPVVVGGPGVSSAPEDYRDYFDILFIGEAELTWPQFIADWKASNHRREYRQITPPDIDISPLPRWDSIDVAEYICGAVQTTRGCPFDCEFCDVIYLNGRRPRHKPIDKVLQEVQALQGLGIQSILLSDDNFTGTPRFAKELLAELISLNNSFEEPLNFQTQLTIDVAKDDEMLELLADANFGRLLIGIETPNKESLLEARKIQNYRLDLIEACKKVQSYGISIRATMIVGFDHDDISIFDEHFDFLQEACIAVPGINILTAPMGTKLWARLKKDERALAIDLELIDRNPRAFFNIIPKKMTRVDLLEGYYNLLTRVRDWDNFAERVCGFVSGVKRRLNVPQKQVQANGRAREFFSFVDEKARRAIFKILMHTRNKAPFMLNRVLGLIFQQFTEIANLQSLHQAIMEQIEFEKSVGVEPFIDRTDILVPESFKAPYRKIFPDIYQCVRSGLKDKTRTNEALIEIFTDFLIHEDGPFEKFEDYHKAFLFEIADRTIKKENDKLVHPLESQEIAPDVKKTELADNILQAVEQELRVVT